jgi:uncharacterized protein YrrD
MRFAKGMKTFTADGEAVGAIDAVVIDPRSKEVTHLVIQKGGLFSDDKLVPVDLIGERREDGYLLNAGANVLGELPDFQETQYVATDDSAVADEYGSQNVADLAPRSFYAYPGVGAVGLGFGAPLFGAAAGAGAPYVVRVERNLPEGAVVLREGTNVIADNGDHVGDVEQIIAEPKDERVTHFVISRGLLLKERKLSRENRADGATRHARCGPRRGHVRGSGAVVSAVANAGSGR